MIKLSRLQRFILVALLDSSHCAKTQRQRNAEIYELFFDCPQDSDYLPNAQASLSRSYRRLETQGLIKRVRGRWQLTDMNDGLENGFVFATFELVKLKELEQKEDVTTS